MEDIRDLTDHQLRETVRAIQHELRERRNARLKKITRIRAEIEAEAQGGYVDPAEGTI